ncbi:MAG TPA: DUF736 domain-containing protein [Casimicrobiaceae bacterium]|jgi:hypothetical protein
MAFVMKDGQGSLFKNDRKEAENQPDYTGKVLIDGTVYRLAAWIKNGKNGKFMSLSAKPDDEQAKPVSKQAGDAPSDDIPF